MSVLALMFLFYYFMDVGLQISTLRSNVLTPAAVTAPLPRLELPSRT
jgi:predicted membrane metal-binding protein